MVEFHNMIPHRHAARLRFAWYFAEFIFYGWGLGRFGSVNRVAQWLFVVAIWGFQLIFSSWWLTRFRYGPLEWLWRSLTYGRLQPL